MRGKDKCRILKQIRQQIADANDIEYITRECTFQGECRGTCPKCEAELRYLEEQLELRRNRGKKAVVAAVAAGIMMTTTTACDFTRATAETSGEPAVEYRGEEEPMGAPPEREEVEIGEVAEEEPIIELEGDVAYIEPTEEEVEIEGDISMPEENDIAVNDDEISADEDTTLVFCSHFDHLNETDESKEKEGFKTPDEMAEYYAAKADGAAE